MNRWAAVILAAGKGTRIKSSKPKVLHSIAGREMLRYVVEAARKITPRRLAIVASDESAKRVKEIFGNTVDYVIQSEPLGTAHALKQARPTLERQVDQVLVMNGDMPLISPETLSAMMDHHNRSEAVLTLLTCPPVDTEGLERILYDASGRVIGVVADQSPDGMPTPIRSGSVVGAGGKVGEVGSGIYCFISSWLWPNLERLSQTRSGEYHLSGLVSVAAEAGQKIETFHTENRLEVVGINNRIRLSQVEEEMRSRIRQRIMLAGVTLINPPSILIDFDVSIGQDTVIYPNTMIMGKTSIGAECTIGPSSIILDSTLGERCRVQASVIEGSVVENEVGIGPFSHVRAESHICSDVHIGNYAEIKKSRLGRGTKMGHFSYIGDAEVGENVNIGAGTITCNFDGVRKNKTVIGNDAFIGSDSMLIAPVTIGERSVTGAGSVINRDVPPDKVAVGVPARLRAKKAPSYPVADPDEIGAQGRVPSD